MTLTSLTDRNSSGAVIGKARKTGNALEKLVLPVLMRKVKGDKSARRFREHRVVLRKRHRFASVVKCGDVVVKKFVFFLFGFKVFHVDPPLHSLKHALHRFCLEPVKPVICPVLFDKLAVGSHLGHAAVVNDHKEVAVAEGGETVGY